MTDAPFYWINRLTSCLEDMPVGTLGKLCKRLLAFFQRYIYYCGDRVYLCYMLTFASGSFLVIEYGHSLLLAGYSGCFCTAFISHSVLWWEWLSEARSKWYRSSCTSVWICWEYEKDWSVFEGKFSPTKLTCYNLILLFANTLRISLVGNILPIFLIAKLDSIILCPAFYHSFYGCNWWNWNVNFWFTFLLMFVMFNRCSGPFREDTCYLSQSSSC